MSKITFRVDVLTLREKNAPFNSDIALAISRLCWRSHSHHRNCR